jgi:hypothetical protein
VQRALARTERAAATAQEERAQQQAAREELQAALARRDEAITDLSEQLARMLAQFEEARREVMAVSKERNDALDEIRNLRYQGEQRWQTDSITTAPAEEVEYPDNWDDLETWVDVYAGDRLVLLPQAIKAAQESPFADISFAYRVMEFLAKHYIALKTRSVDDDAVRQVYERARAELGIEVCGVGTAVNDHRYRSDYRANYNGSEITLDLHAKRYNGMDPTKIFRLYFAWDEASKKVIIGSLPGHLLNRTTHAG